MGYGVSRTALVIGVALGLCLPVFSTDSVAWGNGISADTNHPAYGIHDMAAYIALCEMEASNSSQIQWLSDWYLADGADWGPSFDDDHGDRTEHDNLLAWTDDPDSDIHDWENHALYLHTQPTGQPADGDAERHVWMLYNSTRDELYAWMVDGARRDVHEHRAAYFAGLMSHYLLDITQFGHTDWTQLDHSHPASDPNDATYHSYYESLVWSDAALDLLSVELAKPPLPRPHRVSEPGLLVRELARSTNGWYGWNETIQEGQGDVWVGSLYFEMLNLFIWRWDAWESYKGIRGFDEFLWALTVRNLRAGIDDLSSLWYSAYMDAQDLYVANPNPGKEGGSHHQTYFVIATAVVVMLMVLVFYAQHRQAMRERRPQRPGRMGR